MARRRNDTAHLDKLLASVDEGSLSAEESDYFADQGKSVRYLLLDLIRPDPAQPRRVLPNHVYQEFFSQRLTPSQALRELIQIAQIAARKRGHPFESIVELLSSETQENDMKASDISPEEATLRDLATLAVTIRDDGQVNPVTVVDVSEGVTQAYRIETGERRYWATWLLRDFVPGYEFNGTLPCLVIDAEQSSPFRQAKENTARKGLSAVALARQAGLLLLTVHGYPIPNGPVPNDFYRQALDLTLHGKREYTTDILAAMGGMDRTQFSRYKALLRLCDEAIELADRYGFDEGRLRYVVQLDPLDQVEMLRQIVQFGLTRKQVHDLIHRSDVDNSEEDLSVPPQNVTRLARYLRKSDLPDPTRFAQFLAEQEPDLNVAVARIQSLRQLLDETERQLRS